MTAEGFPVQVCGIAVGHGAVTMLMHRAGVKGLPGSRRRRPDPQLPTATYSSARWCTGTSPNRHQCRDRVSNIHGPVV